MTDGAPARTVVAERGLTAAAVGALVPLMPDLGLDGLGLVKALLKRFFSAGAWTAGDAEALARAVGPPPSPEAAEAEPVRRRLDAELTVVAGWLDGRFALDVERDAAPVPSPGGDATTGPGPGAGAVPATGLEATFASGVVPEPTPNPRTIRFATGHRDVPQATPHRRHDAHDADVAAVFAACDDVVDVLVAADFVAVSIARPVRWPDVLEPILTAVAAGYGASSEARAGHGADGGTHGPSGGWERRTTAGEATPASPAGDRPSTRLDRAWRELGTLDGADADGRARLVAAAADPDPAKRQVAAQLLDRAPLEDAEPRWSELLGDASRAVRRAAVDAVVAAGDERLRPLLERALADPDAWIRWKALHGLGVLGITPSLPAVAGLDDDPDFRVRLEAANLRRAAAGDG